MLDIPQKADPRGRVVSLTVDGLVRPVIELS